MRDYLASYDLRLIEVENGQKAIESVKQTRPDLILMDIQMPVMDGYQAAQILKIDQDLRTIPVVALTAYAMKEQREQYQELFDDYLSKPIVQNDLIATLAKFLPHTEIPVKKSEEPTPKLSEGKPPSQEGNTGRMPVGQDEILDEVTTYMAQTNASPQALLNILQNELLPWHKKASEVMAIDNLVAFAESIIAIDDSFSIPPLKHYGEELLLSVTTFNILKMKRLLALFPDIVEIICSDKE
jgi:CheY-like chemotaxis protein